MSEPAEENPDDFFEAHIDSVSITNMGFIVFLRGEDSQRVLPIFIGPNEAQSIALALNHQASPRPLTHDLLKSMLDALDAAVTRIEVTDLQDNTFYGRVYVSKSQVEELEFDARPSDAMALALRFEAPIFLSRRVFAAASVPFLKPESKETATEEFPSVAPEEKAESGAAPLSPIEQLQQALEKAVNEENYEEAMRLRDALKKLRLGN